MSLWEYRYSSLTEVWEEGLPGVGVGIRKPAPHLPRKVWVSGIFLFPNVKIPTTADLKLPTKNGSGQELSVIHIFEPERVLPSCHWVN